MALPTTDLGWTTLRKLNLNPAWAPFPVSINQRHRYRQKKPFNLILPYESFFGVVKNFTTTNTSFRNGPQWDVDNSPIWSHISWTNVSNDSYKELKGKLYNQASLGVDFVEYKQSVSMIASTATSLAKATRAIKHLRFGEAAAALRMKYVPKGVSAHKSFGNNFLEYHFGWEPLIKDIHESIDVLNNPLKSFRIERSRKSETFQDKWTADFGGVLEKDTIKGRVYAYQGARVRAINNSTYHTLDQFGIINPLSLAWEVVPFSFVVDWFVNVGDYLGSLSDFAGMTLDSTFRTVGYKCSTDSEVFVKTNPAGFRATWQDDFCWTQRITTLSDINFSVKKLKPPSVSRATTAISLLLQQLKK